jgi:four helix bundle protein
MLKDFRKSKVWNLSRYLLLVIFKVTEEVLDDSNSNLIRKMRKSCVEILINIEKIFTHSQNDDYLEYIYRLFAAVRNLEKHLHVAQKMELFQNSYANQLLKKTIEVKCLLVSLVMKIKRNQKVVINGTIIKTRRLVCLEQLNTI